MGLDIHCNVSVKEVRDGLKYSDAQINHPELALKLLDALSPDDTIHTRPGSYYGLHAIRDQFIKLKGLPPEPGINERDQGIPEAHLQYHLLSHSDCDGWYLPNDFAEPIWTPEHLSIGSSVRLLAELQELELLRAKEGCEWGGRWDAVYIQAVASVVTRTPILFC